MAPEKWEKVADIFLALIIYLSLIACLIKSDYNFVVGLFGFLIWSHRHEKDKGVFTTNRRREAGMTMDVRRLLLIILLLTIIYDLVWFLMIKKEWNNEAKTKQGVIWKKLQNLHSIGLFCSFLTLGSKVGIVFALMNAKKDISDDEEYWKQTPSVMEDN